MFWEREIKEDSIYILDEPENSLSAENQIKLKQFIEDSARFYNCQFIISTHSPFLLNLLEAKIYDLDSIPVETKKWTELNNIKIYHEFFKEHETIYTEEKVLKYVNDSMVNNVLQASSMINDIEVGARPTYPIPVIYITVNRL